MSVFAFKVRLSGPTVAVEGVRARLGSQSETLFIVHSMGCVADANGFVTLDFAPSLEDAKRWLIAAALEAVEVVGEDPEEFTMSLLAFEGRDEDYSAPKPPQAPWMN